MIKIFLLCLFFFTINVKSENYFISFDINKIFYESFSEEEKIMEFLNTYTKVVEANENFKFNIPNYLYKKVVKVNDASYKKNLIWNKYYFLTYKHKLNSLLIKIDLENFYQISLLSFINFKMEKSIIDKRNINLFDKMIINDSVYIIVPNKNYKLIFTANTNKPDKDDKLLITNILNISNADPVKYENFILARTITSFYNNKCKRGDINLSKLLINYFYSEIYDKCIYLNSNKNLFDDYSNYDKYKLFQIDHSIDIYDNLSHPIFSNVKIFYSK
tara:strand:+ start:1469 stop:2290 length:822 start_codon:yes stop_codon:yes gene_type:complete